MAININSLSSYVEEHKLPILRNAVIGATTAKEANLMTGVKGSTALNLLNTTISFGDGSACGWNEAGTSALSQRTLVPGAVKINMAFCDKTLLSTWANYDVRVAAGQKNLPFEEDFVNGVVEGVAATLEKAIWNGDNTSTGNANINKFDGFIKIAEAATLADTVTYNTSTSMVARVDAVYAAAPSEVFEKGDVVLYIGADNYRSYVKELIANGNLVLNAGNGAVLDGIAMPAKLLIPGTNVTVIPTCGLDGTNKMFMSYRDNFVYGTDLAGDEERVEFWYSQDNREFRLAIEFTAGVQFAYPDMVVEGKLA